MGSDVGDGAMSYDKLFLFLSYIVVAMVGVALGEAFAGFDRIGSEKVAFMDDCQKYNKPYECIQMWRQK
jgi:hypothetical protein